MKNLGHTLACALVVVVALTPGAAVGEAVQIDFDQVMLNVWTQSAIWTLVATFEVLPPDFTLHPDECDINGGFDASVSPIDLFPNGMLDSDEFALIAAILADPSFDCTAAGGTSHQAVYDAWNQNYAQMYQDLGGGVGGYERLLNPPPTPNMIPDMEYLMTAMMTMGDMDTMTFPLLLLDLVVNDETVQGIINDDNISVPDPEQYTLLYPYLGWCGDADGDGCSNLHEYEHFYPIGGRTQYLAAAMDPLVAPPGCSSDRLCDGSGGLLGEYFNEKNLTDLAVTRKDQQVSFDWGYNQPHPDVGEETFSVCWTGWVEAQYSEVYTFHVRTDDGVRLWVDGERLVDQWTDHGATTYSGTTPGPLVAGQEYPIRMEFYENGGKAVAWLGWESASQPNKAIYEMYLRPDVGLGDRSTDWIRNPANGHCYRITDAMTWPEGRARADAWGGYLVTIDNAAENDWVQGTFGHLGDNFFIGGNDIDSEGTWVWDENDANFWNGTASGSVVPPWYANWNEGEPNDSGGNEDAAHMYCTTGRWNDLNTAGTRRCLVESDAGKLNLTGPLPGGATVFEGWWFSFRMELRHPYGNVTYQWRKYGEDIAGATDAAYTLHPVGYEDEGWYSCVVSDESPATVTTDAVYLSVVPETALPVSGALSIGIVLLASAVGGACVFLRGGGGKAS